MFHVHGLSRALTLLVMAIAVASPVRAQSGPQDFDVTFENCTEFVGIGPASLAEAQASVPSAFSIVNQGGFALIVVRISSCQAVAVAGGTPTPGTVAHIGINIAPPDGQGDINNYTLTYASDVTGLVNRLRANGVPAQHDADLLYEFTRDSSTTGNLLGLVTPDRGPRWHVYGRESDAPPDSQFPFRAIWWYASAGRTVRMDSVFPAIAFGNAQVSFQSPDASILTRLIGGHTIAGFPGLSVRGMFVQAQMTVTARR